MTERTLSGQAAIVGIGQTEFSKESGRSVLQLACEAVRAALDDAGLAAADVDGLATYTVDATNELEIMRNLGIPELRFYSRSPYGGAATCAVLMQAVMAVATGVAEVVVFYRAFNERSETRFGRLQPVTDHASFVRANAGNGSAQWPAYLVYGLATPAMWSSLIFQRYMYRYGVTNEDFGRYAVIARRHAATNPAAWYYEQPITLDDHQQSRWIVEPVLRRLDCCQESDGGIAIVVTTPERARDLPQPAVVVEAAAEAAVFDGDIVTDFYRRDLTRFDDMALVATELWRQSGLGTTDIDAAMLYEHFSPIVFLQLEALGFCGPGQAKDFIAEGNIEFGGMLPVNTHGGHLGEAYIHGINHLTEAVRQLRGTAANQVAHPEHVLVTAGMSAAILGRLP
ncbi:MAG: lipid-transfer protein [Acidimicrobiia bacterium]|nr:lipid-transfer protein [Acidimicrobiia bacterium]